jgi:hypothetical protein
MFKRRNLFKSLIGLFLAPKVVEALPLPKETVSTLGYKGREFFKTGIVYAPYIPLLQTKTIKSMNISESLCKTSEIVIYPAYVQT